MIDIYNESNEATVAQVTKQLVSQGTSIFQIWKKGTTNRKHCKWLLDLARFPQNARVLDIACGVGATAHQMSILRPDLTFALQNTSSSQLALCPSNFLQFKGDMDILDNVPDEAFEAAMVCYALGHVKDLKSFLFNAARVLKPGGMLFVYDIQAGAGSEQWMLDNFNYRTYTASQLAEVAWGERLFGTMEVLEQIRAVELNCKEFLVCCPIMNEAELRLHTRPVGYRFVKSKQVFGPQ